MPYPRQCPAPGNRDDASRQEKMTVVARYPDSTTTSLEQRLRARARDRWPQIASLPIRHRGNFSYVDATLTDGSTLKLCRLRYVGSASQWQFAIYRASHDDYDESVFFTGLPVGTCQDALDTACGLYLNDPTAWTRPPTNLQARPLSKADNPNPRATRVRHRSIPGCDLAMRIESILSLRAMRSCNSISAGSAAAAAPVTRNQPMDTRAASPVSAAARTAARP